MPLRLQVPNVKAEPAVRAAFAVLDSIQGLPREEQIAGVALLFTEFFERLGMDPTQLIDASRRRVAQDLFLGRRDIYGIREYIQQELDK